MRLRSVARRGSSVRIRRRAGMAVDRVVATSWKRFGPRRTAVAVAGDPRLALITVNFSTTRYLKLMLLTLAEQEHLGLVHRLVVVDNASRDGGPQLLDRLEERIPRCHVVHRRRRLGHGPGMRAGIRALDRIDGATERPANLLLFCDTDVVFRSPDALTILVGAALHGDGVFGEVRAGPNPRPDIQASFFAVPRAAYARRDVPPLVHDGSPAYRLQQALVDTGTPLVHLPTNHGGFILHRGRAGVQAAAEHDHGQHRAAVRSQRPHYMGVPGGAAVWSEIESRHAELLDPSRQDELIDRLEQRFARLGTARLVD